VSWTADKLLGGPAQITSHHRLSKAHNCWVARNKGGNGNLWALDNWR